MLFELAFFFIILNFILKFIIYVYTLIMGITFIYFVYDIPLKKII